ncbi:uncharacterized protein UHOD_03471 [Ustilago sp. UG-2017b]|nr:uncharacterized protein UHOD_03471 [Ustilago sp. UG-2017b]
MMSESLNQTCSTAAAGCAGGEGRTLRRRRSAASAALLSRPSMLTLGELVPSFETCVLIYASTGREEAAPELIYALFEPNFLIDGTGRTVRKLDRSSWERLRSHVEDLRIVALASGYTDEPSTPTSPTSATIARRKPECVFDLSMPTDDASQRSISRIYLQPSSYAATPARSRDELFEIEIHGPADAATAEQRRICLPTQVRAVMQDAEQLVSAQLSPTMPTSAPSQMGNQAERMNSNRGAEFDLACSRIFDLLQGPSASS